MFNSFGRLRSYFGAQLAQIRREKNGKDLVLLVVEIRLAKLSLGLDNSNVI